MQGEAFNEGPRQHAYLMKGMGKVDFPITTKSPLVSDAIVTADGGVYTAYGP